MTTYHYAHEKLFDRDHISGVPGAMAALTRDVPTIAEYPDEAAREYAGVAIEAHARIARVAGKPHLSKAVIPNGLRLLVLEKIFQARRLQMPTGMEAALRDVKLNPQIAELLRRAGLTAR